MTTTPDPRPQVLDIDSHGYVVTGVRCQSCGHSMLVRAPRCSRCLSADLTGASFGPCGSVWSSTVVRIPVPGRTPPYSLAYVDIDDGPRVLAHVARTLDRVPVGTRVRLTAMSDIGDLAMEVMA